MSTRLMIIGVIAAVASCAIAAPSATADSSDGPLPAAPAFLIGVTLTSGARLAPGLFFVDPHQLSQQTTTGPMIIDNSGRVVWYDPLPDGESAFNFQVQRYQGQPVLTWWQGTEDNPAFGAFAAGIGQGEDVIMNEHYQIIKIIAGDSSFEPDEHEFYLTPQGNALISGYTNVPNVDLTSVGGSSDGTVIDSMLREINVQTGRVVLTWSALAHVPITDSYALPLFGNSPWDFFHINSISLAPGGSLLISARHMWALYDINPTTGNVNWTLGGKHSTFTVASDAAFAWQHDPRFINRTEIQLFDDEAGVPFSPAASQSRALWIRLDYATRTVSLVKQIIQPASQAESTSQGSVQTLPDGDVIVGWGSAGTFSEYDSAGRQLLQGTLPGPDGTTTLPTGQMVPNSWSTYRVFKERWNGSPATPPVAAAPRNSPGRWTVAAAWNGATQVASWVVLAGPSRQQLTPVAAAAWDGLITPISIAGSNINYVRVVALNKTGRELGISKPVHAGS
jgi:Arylsulfotransferase (ASST)